MMLHATLIVLAAVILGAYPVGFLWAQGYFRGKAAAGRAIVRTIPGDRHGR